MKNRLITLACVVLSLCFLVSLRAQETFRPLITENCVLFVHVDFRNVELDAVKSRFQNMGEEFLNKLGFDKKSLRATIRELDVELDKLEAMLQPAFNVITQDLEIRELAVLADLELVGMEVPLLVVVPWKNRSEEDLETLTQVLQIGDSADYFYVAGDYLFLGDLSNYREDCGEAIQEWYTGKVPSGDALIHQALETVKQDEIKIIFALPPSLREMLEGVIAGDESIPDPFKGLLVYGIQKIQWGSASLSLAGLISDDVPPSSNVFLTIKASKRSDAVQIRALMENAIEWGTNMVRFQMENESNGDFPPMPPLFFEFVKGLMRTFLPDVEGDRLLFRAKGDYLVSPQMGVAIAGAGVALLLPAVQAAQDAAQRMQCVNKIKQIMLAIHNHHDTFNALPPLYSTDANGKPLHSWRVLILPFIEQDSLYSEIRLDEPWDSEHNSQFHDVVIDAYRCPSCPTVQGNQNCNYAVIAGEAFIPAKGKKSQTGLHSITNGTSNTIGIIEVRQPFCWMDPMADVSLADLEEGINTEDGRIGSKHAGGCNVGMLDGSVRFLAETVDKAILRALGTRDGGERDSPGGVFGF